MRDVKSRYWLMASLLVVGFAFNALGQGAPHSSELPNFHQVNSQLYRGAQPKPGGLQRLKAMGVKTIVNLRVADNQTRVEGEEARGLGLRYYNISLPGFSRPKDEEVQHVLDIINAPENQPVFVHCRHGEDRTWTIIACYRITHDSWNAADAKREAKTLGMSWTQLGMKNYIDEYYQRRHRAAGENKLMGLSLSGI